QTVVSVVDCGGIRPRVPGHPNRVEALDLEPEVERLAGVNVGWHRDARLEAPLILRPAAAEPGARRIGGPRRWGNRHLRRFGHVGTVAVMLVLRKPGCRRGCLRLIVACSWRMRRIEAVMKDILALITRNAEPDSIGQGLVVARISINRPREIDVLAA